MSMSDSVDMQKPSAVLKAEHQVILRVIGVLQRLVERSTRGEGFEAASLRRCVEFFRFFADACHHAKEEDLLFPVLESRGIPREGGPIGCMLEEHRLARGHTKDMGEALDALENGDASATALEQCHTRFREAAQRYIELLTSHIDKEENILFNLGDQAMTDDDQSSMGMRFCEVARRSFGGKKREELESVADELEAQWPAT
jgi:hemerythrin-like domain-containing protein